MANTSPIALIGLALTKSEEREQALKEQLDALQSRRAAVATELLEQRAYSIELRKARDEVTPRPQKKVTLPQANEETP